MPVSAMKGNKTRRIHIIGRSGGGKTSLAQSLGSHLGVTIYDLDEVAYEDVGVRTRALDERLDIVKRIAPQPAWITEGMFLWWTDELLRAADVIIWLTIPWRVAAWRTLVQHIKRSLAGNYPHASLRNLMFFMWLVMRYYLSSIPAHPVVPDDDRATTHAATVHKLDQYKGKVVRCRKASDLDRLLASIRGAAGASFHGRMSWLPL